MINQCYAPFWALLGEKAKAHLTSKKIFFFLEPKAQVTLYNSSTVSNENMSPQIKHDIGLGL